MKDKYDKYFWEFEGKNEIKENVKCELLKLKYYLHVLNKGGYKQFKIIAGSNIGCVAITLGMMNEYWQQWIINNIINHVDHQALMLTYINTLNNLLTKERYKDIENVMNSFKISGIIKDIKLDKDEKIFKLQTLDGEYIKFSPEFSNESDIKFYNTHCHDVTKALCMNYDNIYAVTTIMKNYFDHNYYHSFIIKEEVVNDFAQNIVMSFENYKKLF